MIGQDREKGKDVLYVFDVMRIKDGMLGFGIEEQESLRAFFGGDKKVSGSYKTA